MVLNSNLHIIFIVAIGEIITPCLSNQENPSHFWEDWFCGEESIKRHTHYELMGSFLTHKGSLGDDGMGTYHEILGGGVAKDTKVF